MTREEFLRERTEQYVLNGITMESMVVALFDAESGDRTLLDAMIIKRNDIKIAIPKPIEWDEDFAETPDTFTPLT